jgi:hypothetical protein
MPTWVSVTACSLYGLGVLLGIGGIGTGVAGLSNSAGDEGLCWVGVIVSSLPLCVLACVVLAVGLLLALGLAASAAQRKRTIIIEE